MGRDEVIVVDTHAWYFWVTEEPGLSPLARSRLNREREVVVPAMCAWEIAMLSTRGRIDVGPDVGAFLKDALEWEGVRLEPLSPDIGIRAAILSQTHRMEPADQLIAATAIQLNVPLVMHDALLQSLPGLKTIW